MACKCPGCKLETEPQQIGEHDWNVPEINNRKIVRILKHFKVMMCPNCKIRWWANA